jgi:hypothetical protein
MNEENRLCLFLSSNKTHSAEEVTKAKNYIRKRTDGIFCMAETVATETIENGQQWIPLLSLSLSLSLSLTLTLNPIPIEESAFIRERFTRDFHEIRT